MIYKLTPVGTRQVYAPDGEAIDLPVESNTFFQLNGPLMPVTISQPSSAIDITR